MDVKELLRGIELFDGLAEPELAEVAALCQPRQLKDGELLANQGEIGLEFFIISEGLVEVSVRQHDIPRKVVNLGTGQLIGEMSLIDRGPRSATVRAVQDPTYVYVIQHDDFLALCQQNTGIGYSVMYNLAADLSFKLRHRHLSDD